MNKKYLFVLDNVESLEIAERMGTVLTMMGKANSWKLKLQTVCIAHNLIFPLTKTKVMRFFAN